MFERAIIEKSDFKEPALTWRVQINDKVQFAVDLFTATALIVTYPESGKWITLKKECELKKAYKNKQL